MNDKIAMGKGYFVYRSESEKNAIERFCKALSEESLYTINKFLQSYRDQAAKECDKERDYGRTN